MNEPTNFGTNTNEYYPQTGRYALQCPNNTLEIPPYGTLASFADTNRSPTLRYK